MLKLPKTKVAGGILMNKGSIKAVHESNLDEYLASIGVLEKINSGDAFCGICGAQITLENFQCVYPKDNKIMLCCSNISCFKEVIRDGEIVND